MYSLQIQSHAAVAANVVRARPNAVALGGGPRRAAHRPKVAAVGLAEKHAVPHARHETLATKRLKVRVLGAPVGAFLVAVNPGDAAQSIVPTIPVGRVRVPGGAVGVRRTSGWVSRVHREGVRPRGLRVVTVYHDQVGPEENRVEKEDVNPKMNQ